MWNLTLGYDIHLVPYLLIYIHITTYNPTYISCMIQGAKMEQNIKVVLSHESKSPQNRKICKNK